MKEGLCVCVGQVQRMKDRRGHQNLSEWRHKAPYHVRTLLGARVCREPEEHTAARSNFRVERLEPDLCWFP